MPEKKVIEENLRLHEAEAENYESRRPEIYNEREQKRIISVIEEAKEHLETDGPELRALDIGCGTGNVSEKMTARFDEVVGVDLSEHMLSVAYSNYLEERKNMKLVRGRAANLPFSDDHFDMVTAYSVFHHLPDFSEPISEIARVLKKGGVLYIDHEPIKRENLLVKLYIKYRDVMNGKYVEGLPPYENTEGLDRQFCDYRIHREEGGGISTSRVTELCQKHGLEIVTSRKYLAQGSDGGNLLHPILKPFVDDEWLLIGRRKR